MKKWKTRFYIIFSILLAGAIFTGCGQDSELAQFKTSMDAFCTRISEIDSSINSIDAQSDNASAELLGYLDELDLTFQSFAKLDFPDEFDYLEGLADESSQYMTEAVKSFHEAYANGTYNESTAEYARQNYTRSYKRIQIIIAFLHGEEPDDADLSIEYNSR